MPLSPSMQRLRRLAHRLAAAARTERGVRWTRRLRVALQVGVAGALVYQLTRVGWARVLDALPSGPLFYVLLGLHYLTAPALDVAIYTGLWRTDAGRTLLAGLRKRVFNEDLVGYSGEAYLGLWAVERGVERGRAFRDVRDNNILSSTVSLAGTLAAAAGAVALGAFAGAGASGAGAPPALPGGAQLLGLSALPLVVLAVVILVFRRRVFALPLGAALRITALHLARLLATSALMVAMWAVAVPGVPFRAWVALLAAQLLVGRVPFLPGKELLFVGAGVGMAGMLDVAAAAIAGALLVQTAVAKVLNLLVLVSTAPSERAKLAADAPADAPGEPATGPPQPTGGAATTRSSAAT